MWYPLRFASGITVNTQARRKGKKAVAIRKGVLKRAERVVIHEDRKGEFWASGQIMKILENLILTLSCGHWGSRHSPQPGNGVIRSPSSGEPLDLG